MTTKTNKPALRELSRTVNGMARPLSCADLACATTAYRYWEPSDAEAHAAPSGRRIAVERSGDVYSDGVKVAHYVHP